MNRKTLDPNLASILDSIRATVGGEPASAEPYPAAPEPADPAEPAEPAAAGAEPAEPARPARRKTAGAAPTPAGGRTVEEFLADLVRPQVEAWLNANLPELIQKMAAEEIARLTGRK